MVHEMLLSCAAVVLISFAQYGQAIPYSEYILAPASRTIYPAALRFVNGSVTNANSLLNSASGSAVFNGTNSAITIDYLMDIGGLVSVTVGRSSSSDAFIGLTYTESSLWISPDYSDATADAGLDEVLWLAIDSGAGTYSVPSQYERGGFRYLSLVSNTTAMVEVTAVTVDYRAAPEQDLTAYTGWFHCNDDLVNRVWYAGAYTNQMCTIDPTEGDSLAASIPLTANETAIIAQGVGNPPASADAIPETVPWFNNITITNGTTCSTDGAKRDRVVWPGDMVVSLPSILVSTNDMLSIKNSLDSLLLLQASDGMFSYAGYPFGAQIDQVSFTYHLHTMIDLSYYYQYTGDLAYLQSFWDQWKHGMEWSLSSVDSTGLMNVTAPADWLRIGMGGHNIEANAIFYYTLNQGLALAAVLNDTTVTQNWTTTAAGVKAGANRLLWDSSTGLYTDNETTTLSPQDGNSWAVLSNITLSSEQKTAISSSLAARWGTYGAPAPEAGSDSPTISPFVGGFELQAHYLAGHPERAIELIRLQWGDFMLGDPRMTNSTFIEGYSVNGSLHYAPYANDARVSHAHGWSTGPTSALTFYAAGLHLLTESGSTWLIAPQPGGLTSVDAGFSTPLGTFSNSYTATGANGSITNLSLTTPNGTSGEVQLPGVSGSLVSGTGQRVLLVDGVASGVSGGSWKLVAGNYSAAAVGAGVL